MEYWPLTSQTTMWYFIFGVKFAQVITSFSWSHLLMTREWKHIRELFLIQTGFFRTNMKPVNNIFRQFMEMYIWHLMTSNFTNIYTHLIWPLAYFPKKKYGCQQVQINLIEGVKRVLDKHRDAGLLLDLRKAFDCLRPGYFYAICMRIVFHMMLVPVYIPI